MFFYIILAAAVLIGIYLLLLFPGKVQPEVMDKLTGRAYAHRGLHSQRSGVPENTLEAFDVAARHGYGIELDVRLSADGVPVVYHDDTIERLCRIDKRVDELTADQLSKLRVSGSDQFIPRFSEALEIIGGRTPLIVELKPGKDIPALCEKVWALLKDYGGVCAVESFDPRALSWFKRHAPGVVRGQLSTRITDRSLSPVSRFMLENLLMNFLSRPQFIAYEHEYMNNSGFKRCVTAFGAVPCAWTVTDQNTFDNLSLRCPMIIFERFLPPTKFDHTVRIVKGRIVRPD